LIGLSILFGQFEQNALARLAAAPAVIIATRKAVAKSLDRIATTGAVATVTPVLPLVVRVGKGVAF
jgi:hypothetical protein